MKKIVAILMFFALITQPICTFAEKGELEEVPKEDIFRFDLSDEFKEEEQEEPVYTMNEAEKMAVAFGFMDAEGDGNFRNDELLSYREYIKAISALIKTGVEIKALGANVTYEEAVSGLVTVLGYDSYAEYKKSEKTEIAYELGLLKNNVSKTKMITRGEFAELLKNAYSINVCKKTVYAGGDISFSEGNTLLEEIDIKKIQGYVNAVPGLDVFSVVTPKENTIEIDRVEYYIEKWDLTEFLGMNIQGYAKYDDENERWNLLFAKKSSKNDKIYSALSAIDSFASSGLIYTDDEGKSKRVSFSNIKNIIVNGNHGVGIDELKNIDFKHTDGMFSVSKSSNTDYDTLVLWIYDSYTITSVDVLNRKIHFKYAAEYNGKNYVEISEDARLVLSLNGKSASLSDLKQGMSISFVQSDNGEYALFEASDKTISGSVTAVEDGYVYIDNERYNVAQSYIAAAEKEVYKPGDEGDFYITAFGSVCGFAKETNDEIFYAYLKQVVLNDDSPEENMMIKVFNDSGKWENYLLNEKVKIDGRSMRTEEIKKELERKAATIENTMIRMQLNDAGKVAMLDTLNDTAYEKDDSQRIKKAVEKLNTPLYFGGGAFLENTEYKFKNTAKIFYLPEDRTKTNDFKILQISGFKTTDATYKYTFDLYSPDEFLLCDLVVCRDYVQSNSNSMYITGVNDVLNDDDEVELEIEGYVFNYDSSGIRKYRIKADKWETLSQKWQKLTPRMLITVTQTDGYIDDITEIYESDSGDFAFGKVANGIKCGTVKKVDVQRKIILIDAGGKQDSFQHLVSDPKRLVKDASKKMTFENISLSDINPGDRVIMQHGWGFYYSIIVLDK